jgi:ribonuclease R
MKSDPKECLYCQNNETLHNLMIEIAQLSVSRVFLFKEQTYRGRCLVAYKDHVNDLNELSDEDRNAFMADVTRVTRAMQKARYSTHNIGHYGLAFEYYTHFTSPIRRFPDMMVHRLVTKYMDGGRSVSEAKYEDLCDHSSNMEQIAANAERASIKYKQVEFMSERLGQIYDGVISGVTEWGLYVELNENKCEGLVPVRDLDDDYYEFDEKNYCLRGRRKNKIYSLGDAITVRVARANLEKKQLDFELIEK